jgi:peptidoglycan/LPS O-acetylase OafA/YrhL
MSVAGMQAKPELNGGGLLERFRRITASGDYIPEADGLRFLAVLLVLGHHIAARYLIDTHRLGAQRLPEDWAMLAQRDPVINWVLHMTFGVPLFCVISGFVLSIPFLCSYQQEGRPPSWRLYLLRRLIRLEPPYILNMLFMFVLVLLVQEPGLEPWVSLQVRFHTFFPHLLSSLAYLHAQVHQTASWINGVAWTLEIEVQFYLLLPFVAMLFGVKNAAVRRIVWFALIGAAALLAQYVVRPSGIPRLELSVLVQLHYFLAGVLLADLYVQPPSWMVWSALKWDWITAMGGAGVVYVLHSKPQAEALLPYFVMCFCLGAIRGKISRWIFGSPWAALLGGISYTTYLYHNAMIPVLVPWGLRIFPGEHALWLDMLVSFALLTPPILAVSALLYQWTERPFLLLSRRMMREFREAEAAKVAALQP